MFVYLTCDNRTSLTQHIGDFLMRRSIFSMVRKFYMFK